MAKDTPTKTPMGRILSRHLPPLHRVPDIRLREGTPSLQNTCAKLSVIMNYIAALLFAVFLVYAHTASVVKRNSGNEDPQKDPECPGRRPCGWLIYNKSTRQLEIFMNNTCVCSEEKQCSKTDDDLSAGAYVYRCVETKDAMSLE